MDIFMIAPENLYPQRYYDQKDLLNHQVVRQN